MTSKVMFQIGHSMSPKTKPTKEHFTHDWELFVRGFDGRSIEHLIKKVVFNLHESFLNPSRVFKKPPYVVKEQGYCGFDLTIDIYLKNHNEPKKCSYKYFLDFKSSEVKLLFELIVSLPSDNSKEAEETKQNNTVTVEKASSSTVSGSEDKTEGRKGRENIDTSICLTAPSSSSASNISNVAPLRQESKNVSAQVPSKQKVPGASLATDSLNIKEKSKSREANEKIQAPYAKQFRKDQNILSSTHTHEGSSSPHQLLSNSESNMGLGSGPKPKSAFITELTKLMAKFKTLENGEEHDRVLERMKKILARPTSPVAHT